MSEIWKDIAGYDGAYQVSNLGRIKSISRKISCHKKHLRHSEGTVLSPSIKRNGYLGVTLFKNGKRKYVTVHQMVAKVFLLNPRNLVEVNHKNGNTADNDVDNLEWDTRSGNIKHSFRTLNRSSPTGMTGIKGADNPLSKKIIQMDLSGNKVREWDSMQDAGRAGFGVGNIFSCCKGKRKTHKGFKWKYKNDFNQKK